MDLFQALILSIVEGLTEFLPISSTGHLILASRLLNIPQTEFVKSFEIYIQLGAILAVVFIYFQTLISNFKLLKIISIAFLPTAIVGLFLYSFIKQVLIGNLTVTLLALFLGGIALILFEKIGYKKDNSLKSLDQITIKQALLIGLSQSVSVIPGVSRSAASIIGGVFLGLNRKQAVEFSFLLAIPTMAAATALDLIQSDFSFSQDQLLTLGVGFIGSFLTALFSIKLFIKFVHTRGFVTFGVYRIIISILFWLLVLS